MRKTLSYLMVMLLGTIVLGFSLTVDAAPAASPAVTYQVRPDYTNITFTIVKWKVFKEEGMFRDFAGTLTYDPVRPERSSIVLTVQSGSLDTKNSGRDRVAKSDDFLDAERYPTLEFHSTAVKQKSAELLEIDGDFTLHGVTKKITIEANLLGVHEVANVGKLAGFETSFAINRRDYGVLGTTVGRGAGIARR